MIDLAVLGTGAMMPTQERWLSSLLVRLGSQLMLFDAGEGVQIPWRAQGWGIKPLSLVCLSHHHADHIAGIPGVLLALANAGREEPLRIVGPKGTRALVDGLKEAAPVLPYDLNVSDLAPGTTFRWQNLEITVTLGDHRIPVLIYRFDLARRPAFLAEKAETDGIPRINWGDLADGRDVLVDGHPVVAQDYVGPTRPGISFGVATDTRPTPAMRTLLSDIDLLIAEGTYGDDADAINALQNKHMTFREVATLAAEIGARQLLVTHFSPKLGDPAHFLDNGRGVFPGFRLAQPGETITLSYPEPATVV